jgi:pSer/pThr/pTyr-binding forkhead associated (FHA) protein
MPDTNESSKNNPNKDAKVDTNILPNNFLRHFSHPSAKSNGTDEDVTEQRALVLMIRGVTRRVVVTEDLSIVLGRSDANVRFNPDVDLTPYGAAERGVSRAHSRMHIANGQLFITDLGSTNGTFVAGKKLTPNEPQVIRPGDELLLGRLAISIQFE